MTIFWGGGRRTPSKKRVAHVVYPCIHEHPWGVKLRTSPEVGGLGVGGRGWRWGGYGWYGGEVRGYVDLDLGAHLKAHRTPGEGLDGFPDDFAYGLAMPYAALLGPWRASRSIPSGGGGPGLRGASPWRSGPLPLLSPDWASPCPPPPVVEGTPGPWLCALSEHRAKLAVPPLGHADTPVGRRTNLPASRRAAGGPLVPVGSCLARATAGRLPCRCRYPPTLPPQTHRHRPVLPLESHGGVVCPPRLLCARVPCGHPSSLRAWALSAGCFIAATCLMCVSFVVG